MVERTKPPLAHGDVLLDVALQLGSELRLDKLLPKILRTAAQVMEAERALFALVDAHGALQRVKLHNLEWAGPGNPLPISEAAIRDAITQRHQVHADTANDPLYGKHHSVQLHRIRFMVAQPIFVDGDVAAVLYIDSQLRVPGEIAIRMELLEGLAALVSTAVRASRLYEEQHYRAQLLAQMAHDFRTPLNVILNSGEAIEEDDSIDDTGLGREIIEQARRMIHMIDDTLELSRMDAGVVSPLVAVVDLGKEVPRHVQTLEGVARSAELSLQCTAPKSLPNVRTVLDRVWIILNNLIFNAIKHSHAGTVIHIRLAKRGDAGPPSALHRRAGDAQHLFRRVKPIRPLDNSEFVEVAVYNVGTPIPASLMPHVFDEYSRGAANVAGHSSTGLGLSIVDQCVRYLGGAVWVDSSSDNATCFKFTLPTRVAPID